MQGMTASFVAISAPDFLNLTSRPAKEYRTFMRSAHARDPVRDPLSTQLLQT
jgi:hypothetical protein